MLVKLYYKKAIVYERQNHKQFVIKLKILNQLIFVDTLCKFILPLLSISETFTVIISPTLITLVTCSTRLLDKFET